MMDASDVVVLNGVQERSSQFTCRAPRGQGIDDYLAVSCALVERTSEIEYWDEKQSGLKSDHVAIGCKIQLKKVVCLKRRKTKQKRKSFQVVAKQRSWKFWYWLSDVCDKNMEDVLEKIKDEQDVEACWSVLKQGIVDVLERGRKRGKRRKKEEE